MKHQYQRNGVAKSMAAKISVMASNNGVAWHGGEIMAWREN
jgi:hypothetical protein